MSPKNVLLLVFTGAGAVAGFRVVDFFREGARQRRNEMIERVIQEERAAFIESTLKR